MSRYEHTDIYLEQGLIALEEMGMTQEGIVNVRKVMKEKMHWAEDAGFSLGEESGVDRAEKAVGHSLDDLREYL